MNMNLPILIFGIILIAIPIIYIIYILLGPAPRQVSTAGQAAEEKAEMILDQQKLQVAKTLLANLGILKEEDDLREGIPALKKMDLDSPELKDSILKKCSKMHLTDSDSQIAYENTIKLLKEIRDR